MIVTNLHDAELADLAKSVEKCTEIIFGKRMAVFLVVSDPDDPKRVDSLTNVNREDAAIMLNTVAKEYGDGGEIPETVGEA